MTRPSFSQARLNIRTNYNFSVFWSQPSPLMTDTWLFHAVAYIRPPMSTQLLFLNVDRRKLISRAKLNIKIIYSQKEERIPEMSYFW